MVMPSWKLLVASALFLSACDAPEDEFEDVEVADEDDEAQGEAAKDEKAKDDEPARDEYLPSGADDLVRPVDPFELPSNCAVTSGGQIVCAPGGGWDDGGGGGGGTEPGDNCGACLPNSNFEEGGRQWCYGLGYVGCDPYSEP
jgi:hypothetical protein